MKKSCFLAVLAGAVVFFLLGWAQYSLLGGSVYKAQGEPTLHSLLMIFFGCLFSAAIFGFVFNQIGKVACPKLGMKYGAVIGLLNTTAMNFFVFSGGDSASSYYVELSARNFVIDVLIGTIFGAIVGAVVACVLGKTALKAECKTCNCDKKEEKV